MSSRIGSELPITEPATDLVLVNVRSDPSNQVILRRAATACFIGTFVEWFDYASYGYLAVVISTVFFPKTNPTTALLSAYAVFALSFIVRPIGGVIWGHFGDRVGRRDMLSLSILIMSASTFVIAFLPTYQQVGMWAPLLLLMIRLVQGFSALGRIRRRLRLPRRILARRKARPVHQHHAGQRGGRVAVRLGARRHNVCGADEGSTAFLGLAPALPVGCAIRPDRTLHPAQARGTRPGSRRWKTRITWPRRRSRSC